MAQTDRQTDKHPDGHGNSMTESAQWGQFNENKLWMTKKYKLKHIGAKKENPLTFFTFWESQN